MRLNRSSISICLLVLLTGVSGALVGYSSLYLYLSPNLPSVESLRDVKFQTPLRIYSADNKLIGEYGERRTPISISEVSPLLIKAFIAAEDDSFYSHNGFDVWGFLRATSHYLLRTGSGGGGSTLTMQVAKMSFMEDDEALLLDQSRKNNALLTYDQSLLYKAVQILLAIKIEQELSKDEILEIYLNQVFLGHRSYGVQAASQVYYRKDVANLSLAQAAVFAGIQPGPSIYNPISYPDRALRRRGYVLRRMLELDYIDQLQYDQASAEPITARLHGTDLDLSAPYVSELARTHMNDAFGEKAALTGGYRVYTTVDSNLQATAQREVINGLIDYDRRHGYKGPEDSLEPVYYTGADKTPENSSNDDPDNTLQAPVHLYPDVLPVDPLSNLVPEIAKADNEGLGNDKPKQLHLDPWMEELKSRPTYGGFRPAVVVRAESLPVQQESDAGEIIDALDHRLEVVLASGEVVDVPWDNGPSEASPYLGQDRYGYKPKDLSFLKIGDVVRVQQSRSGVWNLVQIPEAQAAFVALDPNTGAIRALVGGFDYHHSTWNRIMQAERQPGSNFKPFLYAHAMEKGYSPASIINDAPFTVEYDEALETDWRVTNSNGRYNGPIPLRQALYRSVNVPAVRVMNDMSRIEFIRSLERFGFGEYEFIDDGLSAALGSQALKPIDVATAYAVFANGGFKVEHYLIDRIELEGTGVVYQADHPVVCRECELEQLASTNNTANSDEQPTDEGFAEESPFDDFLADAELVENQSQEQQAIEKPTNIAPRVLDERVAFLVHNMLQDVITKGTGRRALALRRNDLAGKTATTNDNTNAWFSGYNQQLVGTVWVGFDQNLSLGQHEEGGKAALPIWIEFMRSALRNSPEQLREQPPGVVNVKINPKTGLRTHNPDGVFEYFLIENVPEYEDGLGPANPIYDQDDTQQRPRNIF